MLEITAQNYKDYLEFVELDVLINDLIFHIDIIMFKIKKYDGALEELMTEGKDYRFLAEEFMDIIEAFRAVAGDLEKALTRYFEVERALGLPANFSYKKLLKSIKESPIPRIKL